MQKPWRTSLTSTSDLISPDQDAEVRRDRMQRLVQNAIGEYDLRFEFGETDQMSSGHLVLGMKPELVRSATHAALMGRVLHLLGHYINESTLWLPSVQREQDQGQPYFTSLWHALEDARIENNMVVRWPGSEKFLKLKVLPNLGGSLIPLMATTQQIELALYLEGRGYQGAAWSPNIQDSLEQIADQISEGTSGQTARSSLEAMVRIYPQIAHLLRGEHVPMTQAAAAWNPESLQLSESTTTGQEHSTVEEIDPSRSKTDLDSALIAVGLSGREQELPEWFRPGSAPWFERGLGDKQVHPAAVREDRETIIEPPMGDRSAYLALQKEVKHDAGFLVRRLMLFMREEVYLRYGGHFRTGTLNTAKLWRQRLGVYRLFQRPLSGRERPVAVSLLVDESASMQGLGKARMAAKTAILLGETLNQLDIPLEIIGFSTAEYEAQAALNLGLLPAHQYRTTRCSPLEHRLYKRFSEPFSFVRTRLVDIQPRHNNWDEEHLLFAFRRIQSRTETRKIIIVISDGQPNGDAEYLMRTIASIEHAHCKVIGVGIGADFVKELYTDAVVVSDFHQMTRELLGLLVREFNDGLLPMKFARNQIPTTGVA
jgi:hypothetical protein